MVAKGQCEVEEDPNLSKVVKQWEAGSVHHNGNNLQSRRAVEKGTDEESAHGKAPQE